MVINCWQLKQFCYGVAILLLLTNIACYRYTKIILASQLLLLFNNQLQHLLATCYWNGQMKSDPLKQHACSAWCLHVLIKMMITNNNPVFLQWNGSISSYHYAYIQLITITLQRQLNGIVLYSCLNSCNYIAAIAIILLCQYKNEMKLRLCSLSLAIAAGI